MKSKEDILKNTPPDDGWDKEQYPSAVYSKKEVMYAMDEWAKELEEENERLKTFKTEFDKWYAVRGQYIDDSELTQLSQL